MTCSQNLTCDSLDINTLDSIYVIKAFFQVTLLGGNTFYSQGISFYTGCDN